MSGVGNISIDEARNLVGTPDLWPRVRDFLWNFVPSIHRSWLEERKVEAPDSPSGLPFSDLDLSAWRSPRVRRFLLDALGVEPCFHLFPKEDGSRLLLLDGEVLLDIVKWLGALSCADSLRRVTSGGTVRALKAALPGVYPDVFGYTMYFKKLRLPDLQVEGSDVILQVGLSILLSFFDGLSDPLRHRLLLKLPKTLRPFDTASSNLQLPTLQPATLQLLLKLHFPEAHSLCY